MPYNFSVPKAGLTVKIPIFKICEIKVQAKIRNGYSKNIGRIFAARKKKTISER